MAARKLARSEPSVPEYRIGRYRVRARLGKGGMGVVYLGKDEALDRDVAIKTLRVDGSQDDENRGRFEIEAKAAARLQHPNIVTVFELGEDRGLPYIAMELLGGQDLETLLRSHEPLTATERLDIAIQTLRGLEFAHAHQIIHRDIKPSNIRVLDDGGVKILDFGIAKVESASVTRAGMMVGTPFYMSPEHIRGNVLDGRSDVFAVGVILHELFAGTRPFAADSPTLVLYGIVNEPHPRLKLDAAGPLTADVQRVIDKALEKHAEDRFGSAAEMADELARVRKRHSAPPLPMGDQASLSQVRKLLATDQVDSGTVRTVERIARTHPETAEAQRMLRLVKRRPAEPGAAAETLAFPELDASFGRATGGADQTVGSGRTIGGRVETVLRGGPSPGAAAPAQHHSNAVLYGAIATCVITGSIAAFLYFTRVRSPEVAATPPIKEVFVPRPAPSASNPAATKPAPEKPAPAALPNRPAVAVIPKAMVEIRTQPKGASVLLDRKAIGVTPLRIEIASNTAHAISLSLSGYQSKDLKIAPPIPSSVDTTLQPVGPPSSLIVESAYPVTISVSGRVIASNKPGISTTLPSGDYEIVVESSSLFLNHRESVHLDAGGAFAYRAPGTGKVGVRAAPDNCKVFVDGVFVDYPPIIDRTIVAGDHVVSFEWPDGAKAQQRVQIREGRPSYVMGRKP
ncbi:MAG: serine/threonine protein kinase [Vicinamibacteria bacterium]|nr:serine/threonine protein kinase [Vicinamibacteria bacterium]